MRNLKFESTLLSATALILLISASDALFGGSVAQAAPAAPPLASPGSLAGVKIAIANPAHIFNEMAETKALQASMAEDQKKFQAAQHDKVAEMEHLKGQRDQLDPDHPQWAEMNTQLATLAAQYKVWVETQKAVYETTQKQRFKQLFKKIEDAVGEIAKRDNIDLVIADSRDPLPSNLDDISVSLLREMLLRRDVVYSNDKLDISMVVITLLDARYRTVSAVPNK